MKKHQAALLFAFVNSCFAADSLSPSEELVRVARFDFAMIDALQYSKGLHLFDARQYEKIAPCISARGADLIRPIVAKVISEKVSQEDIQVAFQFYESPVGKKFTEASLIAVHHEHQIEMEKPIPEFSPEEKIIIDNFMESSVRKKITNSISDRTALLNETKREIYYACAAD